MLEEEMLREIRLQTAILKAAFRDRIDAFMEEVRADHVATGIIDHLDQNRRTRSGVLKAAVAKAMPQGTDASTRTISRRLAELENKGAIEKLGQGNNTEYQLTGLIR